MVAIIASEGKSKSAVLILSANANMSSSSRTSIAIVAIRTWAIWSNSRRYSRYTLRDTRADRPCGARELDEIESPTDDNPGVQVVPKLGNDDVRTTSVPAGTEAYLVDSTCCNDLLMHAAKVDLLPFVVQHLLVFVDVLLNTPLAICGINVAK